MWEIEIGGLQIIIRIKKKVNLDIDGRGGRCRRDAGTTFLWQFLSYYRLLERIGTVHLGEVRSDGGKMESEDMGGGVIKLLLLWIKYIAS